MRVPLHMCVCVYVGDSGQCVRYRQWLDRSSTPVGTAFVVFACQIYYVFCQQL